MQNLNFGDSQVTVYHYGATITSWKYKGVEQLFTSEKAVLDGTKPIRGGIPLIFPQFGAPPGTKIIKHGFARVSTWKWLGISIHNDSCLVASFKLTDQEVSPDHLKSFPFKFELIYTITLAANTLSTSLQVKNLSVEAFEFSSLLHTYFKVDDIHKVQVLGLEGIHYSDNSVKGQGAKMLQKGPVLIQEEVDRVYHPVPLDYITIKDGSSSMVVAKQNYQQVVVWNPWEELAKGLNDLQDSGYHHMICVEVGNVLGTRLKSMETFTAGQSLIAL